MFILTPLRALLASASGALLLTIVPVSDGRPMPSAPTMAGAPMRDDLAWLEPLDGREAVEWVRRENARTLRTLRKDSRFERRREAALNVELDANRLSRERELHNGWIYEILRDRQHPLGLWRRTRIESYRTRAPKWQDLLDLDSLSRREGKKWVLQRPTSFLGSRALVRLSFDGTGSYEIREFDLEAAQFVSDGFVVPQRMSARAVWHDPDTVFVQDALNTIRKWSRGTQLNESPTVLNAEKTDKTLGLLNYVDENGKVLTILARLTATEGLIQLLWTADGNLRRLELPPGHAIRGFYKGQCIIELTRDDWIVQGHTWKAGSLISVPVADLTQATPKSIRLVASPGSREGFDRIAITRDGVLLLSYESVRARLSRLSFSDGKWVRESIPVPDHGKLSLVMAEPTAPTAFAVYENFLQPPTIYEVQVATKRIVEIWKAAAQFDSTGHRTEQFEAISKDGTRVPYFVVMPTRGSNWKDGVPTILEGYGYNGAVNTPRYDASLGALWLKEGGAFVLANVRGGGEFGPSWHVTGTARQRTYEDFLAVAEDLVRRGITSPRRLGIRGHSNGGLLAAVALNMKPNLFAAALISHAVLDQLRSYSTVMKAPWLGNPEYGYLNVPEEYAFLARTSPYQNLSTKAGFPLTFVTSSTHDTDCPPQQSRKYAARLGAVGVPYLYYESAEGGHDQGVTPAARAQYAAMMFTYFAQRLM